MPPTLRAFKGEKIHASKHLLIVHTQSSAKGFSCTISTDYALSIDSCNIFSKEKKNWGGGGERWSFSRFLPSRWTTKNTGSVSQAQNDANLLCYSFFPYQPTGS
jgi:hypothetical protein